MRISKCVAGALMFATATFGFSSAAMGLSFIEFERLKGDQQENFIQTALHFYYYGYQANPSTNAKATCMYGLNDRIVDGGKSYLWVRVLDDLNSERARSAKPNSVEGVIKATIERECPAQ